MAKNKISEYSATSANNTDISNINIAEGCSPANVNNAIRTLMAQLKDQQDGTSGDPFTVGGNLTVTGTTTLTGATTLTGGLTSALPVASGGTGATTASGARTSLSAAKSGANSDITSITGLTTALTVAQGGTGITTFGTGVATALGQNVSGSGSIVLGTSPTLTTPALGTPSAVVLTNATGTANSLNAGIGVNQTWQDVSASRAWSTNYTNSTGKPIMFSVTNSASDCGIELIVGGVNIGSQGQTGGSGDDLINMAAIVPNGATYRANPLRVAGGLTWVELS